MDWVLAISFIALVIGLTIIILLVALIQLEHENMERQTRALGELVGRVNVIDKERDGKVTKPFDKVVRDVNTDSESVVRMKAPNQIRNENFEKIKQGQYYGHQ